MVNKATTEGAKPFENGQEQAGVMLGMQREVLEACDQASRAWLERVKSEVELWTELAAKLSATRSLPEAIGIYQDYMTHWMQMAAETGAGCLTTVKSFCNGSPGRCPTGGRPAVPERNRVLQISRRKVAFAH
jgi:hypothetical protein